jgi:transglutaminase-like putative cysteine protease
MTQATSTPTGQAKEAREDAAFGGSVVALTALTLVATVGMGRLFADGTFLGPLCAAAVVTHVVSWYARRLGLGLAAGLFLAAGAVGITVAWVVLRHTTAYGIPWMGTWHAASDELSKSWSEFSKVVAPAPVTKGFLIAGMAGVGVTAFLADWAAYRVRTTFEPLLPSFTLFLFASALGAPRHRGLATAAYVAAVLLFLVVHQAALRADTTAWFASRSRGGVGALLQGAAAIGLAAVLASVFVGPNLPGAEAKAVIAWRKSGEGGNRDRVTTSPLVDIRGRLVTQQDIEVFSVKSNVRAYWQLTTLDTFDGRIWSSNSTYTSVKRNLPGGISDAVKETHAVQEFAIEALEAIWLPVAYRPTRIEGVSGVSYNADLGSLISRRATSDGLQYTVASEIPEFRPDALNTAKAIAPDHRFLELPALPTQVIDLAQRITRDQPTAYLKAKALQDHFRKNFTYDLKTRPGHDDRALLNFLFRDKKGYCEQFAGAYAAMARAVGLPTRVAVGFTPGELQPDGRYHVRGLNAHAWPEVYMGEFGWVAFEPTPGRGRPGAEQYTGVTESQANPANPSTAITQPPAPPPTQAPGGTTATTKNPNERLDTGGSGGGFLTPKRTNPILRALAVVVGLALLWLLVVPLLLRRRRMRRRAAAASAVDRVLAAWEEAGEALARAGAPRRPSETVREYASRGPLTAVAGDEAGVAMRELAQQTSVASYSPGSLPAETVARAIAAAATVEAAVSSRAGRRRRLFWLVDPRPLLPRRVREITGKAGSQRSAA